MSEYAFIINFLYHKIYLSTVNITDNHKINTSKVHVIRQKKSSDHDSSLLIHCVTLFSINYINILQFLKLYDVHMSNYKKRQFRGSKAGMKINF